jgi:hypothetical protein
MDLADPKTWADGLKVVLEAPHIVVPLLVAVGGAAYWFRGSMAKAAIDGLKEQNQALVERNSVLEAHREFAETRAGEFDRKLGLVTAQLTTLEGQIKRGEPQQGLLLTAAATTANVGELQVITSQLTHALRVPMVETPQQMTVGTTVQRATGKSG